MCGRKHHKKKTRTTKEKRRKRLCRLAPEKRASEAASKLKPYDVPRIQKRGPKKTARKKGRTARKGSHNRAAETQKKGQGAVQDGPSGTPPQAHWVRRHIGHPFSLSMLSAGIAIAARKRLREKGREIHHHRNSRCSSYS